MFKRLAAPTLALWCFVFAQSARAFFDPPWITPASPTAEEPVFVNIYGGMCDFIVGAAGYPQITQDGNAIRVREYGFHYEPGDELCGDGTGTVTVPIGRFVPGQYTVTVELAYIDGFGTPSILPIGVVPFTVSAPHISAAPVPTNSVPALFTLMLALLVTAGALRHRHV